MLLMTLETSACGIARRIAASIWSQTFAVSWIRIAVFGTDVQFNSSGVSRRKEIPLPARETARMSPQAGAGEKSGRNSHGIATRLVSSR